VDIINNCLNSIFPAFNSLNQEFSPNSYLIDNFSNCFSFYLASYKNTNVKTAYCNKLKKVYKESSNNQNIIFIISNANVRNNVTTLVLHIWKKHEIITKTVYHIINISSTEAKLFVIRCGICWILQI